MRTALPLVMAVAACGGDTGFSQGGSDVDEVTGTGAMEVTPAEVVFLDCEPELAYSELFKITSTGDSTLQIYTVDLSDSAGGVFYMAEEADLSLMPGGVKEFTVVATLPDADTTTDTGGDGSVVGEARIKTNDQNNLDYRLPLIAWPPGAGPSGGDDTGGDDTGGDDTGIR